SGSSGSSGSDGSDGSSGSNGSSGSSGSRRTTASTDAILGMSVAPVYIFNSELDSLRARRDYIMYDDITPGGVWAGFTGGDFRIGGLAGTRADFKLRQWGLMVGGEAVLVSGEAGQLVAGAFVSYTDNRIRHARGGYSRTGSTGGGLYATWLNSDGWYLDGGVQVNSFSHELNTRMSDGVHVSGNYRQTGFGGSLETGYNWRVSEDMWVQPYVRATAFHAGSHGVSLDNGMKARTGALHSWRTEVGVNTGMNLDVAGMRVSPYLKAGVSHEFADNNVVRINDRWEFRNDISETTGKYGMGVSAQLSPVASVSAEVDYQKGSKSEFPLTVTAGFRISF
ncbi:autotransporter outer membrane beta-barrel domain-containing protein, partial [Escherichia coli]|nr:autotransporter outer membrane beta-barrel domain-containing protein [Escherichia coli]